MTLKFNFFKFCLAGLASLTLSACDETAQNVSANNNTQIAESGSAGSAQSTQNLNFSADSRALTEACLAILGGDRSAGDRLGQLGYVKKKTPSRIVRYMKEKPITLGSVLAGKGESISLESRHDDLCNISHTVWNVSAGTLKYEIISDLANLGYSKAQLFDDRGNSYEGYTRNGRNLRIFFSAQSYSGSNLIASALIIQK